MKRVLMRMVQFDVFGGHATYIAFRRVEDDEVETLRRIYERNQDAELAASLGLDPTKAFIVEEGESG